MPFLLMVWLAASLVFWPQPGTTANTGSKGATHGKARLPKIRRPPPQVQQSPFCHSRLLILNNGFAFNSFSDFGSNAFDPNIFGRILVTRETLWAFGPLQTNSLYDLILVPENDTSAVIDIQPLSVEQVGWHPFFGRLNASGALSDNGDDSLDAFVWHNGSELIMPPPGTAGNTGDLSAGSNRSPLAYRYAVDKTTSLNAGFNWIHDLRDTIGMAQALEEPGSDSAGKASGVNVSVGARYKAVTLTGGYIRAMDPRSPVEFALDTKENDPIAWNSELAYSTEFLRRETTLAIGYLKASDSLNALLPEERYSTKASMALSHSTTLSLEYYQDREIGIGNDNEDGYGITTRIGFDF